MAKRPILLTTLAFTLMGPFIGALLVVLWAIAMTALDGRHLFSTQDLTIVAPVLVWAYALGWLPASVVGLTWGLFYVRLNRSRSLTPMLRATTGAGLGALCGAATGLLLDGSASTSLQHTRLVLLCAPCGLVAGSFLCMTFPRAPWLQHGPLTIVGGGREA